MRIEQNIFIVCWTGINCIAYITMWYDKIKSKKKGSRIPERSLFLMAFLFGAPGIYLGMKAPLHHKASKTKFKWGIPSFFILNIICIYFLLRCFSST